MPCKLHRLRWAVLGALIVLTAGSSTALAQTPLSDLLSRLNPTQRATTREGQATQAESGPVAQTAVGQAQPAAVAPVPFGASLFTNATAPASDVANPDYRIQPGDRIGLNTLGAPTSGADSAGAAQGGTLSLVVDLQGNVFLPEVGPVHVGGIRADTLQSVVQAAAGRVFTSKVSVYAVLQTVHSVGVYVSGFVARPGRYSGSGSDSVLDYLVRAGGVDPSRGSYRNIVVIRGGRTVAQVDLYQFLLTGETPGGSLREGDTILVGRQSAMVAVDGAVRNNYLFELPSPQTAGAEIIGLSSPLPSATHAVISGSRDNKPFSVYVTLQALVATTIQDQDKITFIGDQPASTVQVRVEGSRIGPSYLVLPSDSRLSQALEKITVDPALADEGSVYILRRSIAEQQARVIGEATDRLQKALFLAVSPTTGVATIRASEAQLISGYIERARRATPDGRLVVTDDSGRVADVRLEADDVIVIPAKSQVVMVAGEVLAPQAVLYRPGMKREAYVEAAGGYSERGRSGRVLIRRANGALFVDRKTTLRPGDELVVLPYIDPKFFQLGSDMVSLLYQVALGGAVFNNLK